MTYLRVTVADHKANDGVGAFFWIARFPGGASELAAISAMVPKEALPDIKNCDHNFWLDLIEEDGNHIDEVGLDSQTAHRMCGKYLQEFFANRPRHCCVEDILYDPPLLALPDGFIELEQST